MSRARRPHGGRTSALLVLIILMLAVPAPALSAPISSDESPGGGRDQGVDSAAGGDRAMAKWTYLVYMSADNNLEDEAILNFNQMEMVGSSDDLNIIVQFDRSPLYDETNGNWTSAVAETGILNFDMVISPDLAPGRVFFQFIAQGAGTVDSVEMFAAAA